MNEVRELDSLTCALTGVNLIEAAAGTGKTYNIQNLVVRFILEQALRIDQVLVVTFTDAAAAELRDRIRRILTDTLHTATATGCAPEERNRTQALLARAAAAGVAPEECVRRLRRALQDFDDAAISTIHGFCQKVLSEHAFESGILFNSRLEPRAGDILAELTLDFYRHCLYAEPGAALRNQLLEYEKLDSAALTRIVQKFLGRRGLYPHIDFAPLLTAAEYAAQIAGQLEALRPLYHPELIDRLDPLLGARAERADGGLLAGFQAAGPAAPGVLAQLARLNPETLAANRLKGKAQAEKVQRLAQWEALTEEPFFRALPPLFETVRRHRIALQLEAVAAVRERFQQRKIRENFQTFDDLLNRVHDGIFQNDGHLLPALRNRFRAGIIDEFQDTDQVQYEIFAALFGPDRDDGAAWFMVGDPRQAIYAFRGGDIATYRRADRERAARGGAKHTLNANYRSAAAMIAATNRLFAEHACPFADPQITFSAIQAPLKGDAPEPGLTRDGQPDPHPLRLFYNMQYNQSEMRRLCVEKIHELLTSDFHLPRRDRPGIRPGDIVVLVLKGSEAEEIKMRLNRKGIPAVFTRTGNIFASPDAAELLKLLQALATPRQSALILTALATAIGGLSLAELAALSTDSVQVGAYQECFQELAEHWRRQSFIAMFHTLLRRFAVRGRYPALPDGERKLTNLLQLGDLLQQEEAHHQLTPQALIDFLARRIAESADEKNEAYEQLLETDRSAVKLMTIHGSKGLEFPIVMLPGLYLGNAGDEKKLGEYHADARIEYDLSGDPVAAQRSKSERLQELLRLAYVAITRAKYRCYLFWGKSQGRATALDWLFRMRRHAWRADFFDALDACRDEPDIPAEFLEDEPAVIAGCYRQSVDEALELTCRVAHPAIDPGWRVVSYSSLAAGGGHDGGPFDFDPGEPAESESFDRAAAIDPVPFEFEGGAAAGSVWHRILERLDFQADRAGLRAAAEPELATGGLLRDPATAERRLELAAELLHRVCHAPLQPAGAPAFTLAELQPTARLNELEFCCGIADSFPTRTLYQLVAAAARQRFPLEPAEPNHGEVLTGGYLEGFIDLVFRHQGRYYLADWKSNRLQGRLDNFAADRLPTAMARNGYFLQYAIYVTALVRYLRCRLGHFDAADYDAQFGGVFYLFLRGMSPEAPGRGVFYDRPDYELIRQIDHLLGGDL